MKYGVAAAVAVSSACLFPSLDGLTGSGVDASSDVTIVEGGADAGDASNKSDAGDAGPCPVTGDPSLVLYYRFDEGSGTIIHDCSPHGFDGVLTGGDSGSGWTTGHSGSGILFAPADSACVIVNSAGANQTGGALTVTAWTTLLDPNGGYIIGQRHTTGYAWRIDVEANDAGPDLGFAIGLGDDGGNDDNADTIMQTNAWHHIAAVFDPASGGMQALFLDGVKTLSQSPASVIIPDPDPTTIRIGCRGDDSNYYPGVIDEVRVYSRALSDAEIATLASK